MNMNRVCESARVVLQREGRERRTQTGKAGSLLITLVFNIRKCQNENGAHIILSIALLATAKEREKERWKNLGFEAVGLN